jgi:hypothetical protein
MTVASKRMDGTMFTALLVLFGTPAGQCAFGQEMTDSLRVPPHCHNGAQGQTPFPGAQRSARKDHLRLEPAFPDNRSANSVMR